MPSAFRLMPSAFRPPHTPHAAPHRISRSLMSGRNPSMKSRIPHDAPCNPVDRARDAARQGSKTDRTATGLFVLLSTQYPPVRIRTVGRSAPDPAYIAIILYLAITDLSAPFICGAGSGHVPRMSRPVGHRYIEYKLHTTYRYRYDIGYIRILYTYCMNYDD